MLHVRATNLEPDPFDLARRLAGRDAVALIWARGGRVAYLACDPIEKSAALDPEPSLPLAAAASDAGVPRWIGLIPYEARRVLERGTASDRRAPPELGLPTWFRYGAVAEISNRVQLIGDDPKQLHALEQALLGPAHATSVRFSVASDFEPARRHIERIQRALELIMAGDLYQVNLARRFDFRVEGAPWDVLAELARRGRPPYSAAFRLAEGDVIALSPELCLSLDTSGELLTSPIKGTRPRGKDPADDARLARELGEDPKECAELTMVLDVERNDLGRIGATGSVRLVEPPHVKTHATVHHRLATLGARLRPGVSREEHLRVMLPSGSVTGAPKIRAMDLIAELEAERRGLYTGAFGYLAHDGSLELGMAIRVLTVRGGEGHYFAGGGIVADSVPEREVEETLWKVQALLDLLRPSARSAPTEN